jgi:hypothetical protein
MSKSLPSCACSLISCVKEIANLSEAFFLSTGEQPVLGKREPGALLPVARFGNWLSTRLIRWGWGFAYTDLGPFRALRYSSLPALGMQDPDFGWTVEMQVRALSCGLRVREVAVSYRKRIGKSKISGTILGSYRAGRKILFIIFREFFRRPRRG